MEPSILKLEMIAAVALSHPFLQPFRHRRSIEGSRQEREEHLQSCRRARSLSPGKHPRSVPQEATPSSKARTPSRRKEYLQQLRQEVIDSSRYGLDARLIYWPR